MALPRTPMPSYPGTPQVRASLMSQINQAYQNPGQYAFGAQGAPLPGHMPQYSYGIGSPARPGSAFGQADVEDDFNNVDGEYYDPEEQGQFYVPDSSLVQDWPFGHKAGVEGKSTITYAPQMQPSRGFGQTDPGMFANALRGQSIQYGNFPQQQGPAVRPAMPGPGFFAQSTQPSQPTVPQGPSQQLGGIMGVAGQSPAMSPKPPTQTTAAVSKPPSTSIMPPNAVASTSMTTKPRLIPESVGVPSPKPGEKPVTQSSTLSQQQAGQGIFGKPVGQAQVPTSEGPASSASLLASLLTDPKLAGQGTGFPPGSAASVLNTLAMKHQQEASQSQATIAAPTPATTIQSTPQKTVFSGFSFTSTPKITENKVEEKPKPPVTTSAPEQKPFGGFSFTLPSKTTTTTPATITETPKPAQQTPTPTTTSTFMLGQNAMSPSFASLAASEGGAKAFQAGGDFNGFQGAGQALFGKMPSPSKGDKSLDEDHVDEYEPEVDFKPVVPLPALVTVKTGEEDEEKLFSERTKLFRFDPESNQWKERGIGELKILKNKETKKVRILMRREQVLKVCANHTISKEMKLTPMSSSDKAWCWNAMDYSEGEMKREQLAAKFKNADIAARFKEVFEECLAEIAAAEKNPDVEKTKPKEAEKPKAGKGDLSSLFKQKTGSWSCDGCLITNDGEVLKCPCCGTLKPGVKAEDIKEEKPSAGFGKFVAPSADSGFKFGGRASAGSSQTGSGFKFGTPATAGESAVSQSGGFKFGSQPNAGTDDAGGKPAASGFKFGTPSTTDSAKPTSGGFKFGVQPSDAAESKENVKDKADGKTLDLSKQATSAGFIVDKDSIKYTFETPTKSTEAKKETNEKDESNTCNTKPNLLAHLLESENNMWKCDKCLVNNDEKELKCVCCGESRPGIKTETAQHPATSLSKFGAKPGSGFNIGGFGTTSNTSGFTFGSQQVSDKPKVEESAKPKPFTFGDAAKSAVGFSFGTPTKADPFKFEPDNKPSSVSSEGFNFSMSMTPAMPHSGRSPLKSPGVKSPGITSPKSPEVGDDGYYVTREEDDSHIFFEPVIPLPDKVEVKTGEEGEEVMYSHRAKLFRFVNGEWKERGLGDIKVLYDSSENKARLLMRREHILKICCNHYITKDINMKIMPNSKDCALVWYAMDFADDEQKAENFSCKFKTAEIAQDFKVAVEAAKSRLSGEKVELPTKETSKALETTHPKVETIGAVSSDDVIFIKEECAAQEEVQKARQYLLPDNFYMYLKKSPCPGCRGCDSDNFEMKTEVVQATSGNKVVQETLAAFKQDKLETTKKETKHEKIETIKQAGGATADDENEKDEEEYVIDEEDYEEDYDVNEEDEDSDDEYETEEEEEDENVDEEGEYCDDQKNLVWAHSEKPRSDFQSRLIRVYTVCHAFYIFWTHCILKPAYSFLARLNKVHGELLYYPRHWR